MMVFDCADCLLLVFVFNCFYDTVSAQHFGQCKLLNALYRPTENKAGFGRLF